MLIQKESIYFLLALFCRSTVIWLMFQIWLVGSRCRAVFSEDDLIYDAVIESLDRDAGTCWVRYVLLFEKFQFFLTPLVEHTCVYAQWAQMSHFPSICLTSKQFISQLHFGQLCDGKLTCTKGDDEPCKYMIALGHVEAFMPTYTLD